MKFLNIFNFKKNDKEKINNEIINYFVFCNLNINNNFKDSWLNVIIYLLRLNSQ